MPTYMDVHDLPGVKAEAVAAGGVVRATLECAGLQVVARGEARSGAADDGDVHRVVDVGLRAERQQQDHDRSEEADVRMSAREREEHVLDGDVGDDDGIGFLRRPRNRCRWKCSPKTMHASSICRPCHRSRRPARRASPSTRASTRAPGRT